MDSILQSLTSKMNIMIDKLGELEDMNRRLRALEMAGNQTPHANIYQPTESNQPQHWANNNTLPRDTLIPNQTRKGALLQTPTHTELPLNPWQLGQGGQATQAPPIIQHQPQRPDTRPPGPTYNANYNQTTNGRARVIPQEQPTHSKNQNFGPLTKKLFQKVQVQRANDVWRKATPATISKTVDQTIDEIKLPMPGMELAKSWTNLKQKIKEEIQKVALQHLDQKNKEIDKALMELNPLDKERAAKEARAQINNHFGRKVRPGEVDEILKRSIGIIGIKNPSEKLNMNTTKPDTNQTITANTASSTNTVLSGPTESDHGQEITEQTTPPQPTPMETNGAPTVTRPKRQRATPTPEPIPTHNRFESLSNPEDTDEETNDNDPEQGKCDHSRPSKKAKATKKTADTTGTTTGRPAEMTTGGQGPPPGTSKEADPLTPEFTNYLDQQPTLKTKNTKTVTNQPIESDSDDGILPSSFRKFLDEEFFREDRQRRKLTTRSQSASRVSAASISLTPHRNQIYGGPSTQQ